MNDFTMARPDGGAPSWPPPAPYLHHAPPAPLLSYRSYQLGSDAPYGMYSMLPPILPPPPPSSSQFFGAPVPSAYHSLAPSTPFYRLHHDQAYAHPGYPAEAYHAQRVLPQPQWPPEGVWGYDARQSAPHLRQALPHWGQANTGGVAERRDAGGELGALGAIGTRPPRSHVNRAVDHDHPSFDHPPHREVARRVEEPSHATVAVPVSTSASIKEEHVVYDLVSNTSTVPPPPTVERSAVPLADLAVEMVWDACALSVTTPSASTTATMPMTTNSRGGSPQRCPTTPPSARLSELYGTIGDGRQRKNARASSEAVGSIGSSPASSGPGTPADVGAVEAAAARKQRLAGLGFAFNADSDIKPHQTHHSSPGAFVEAMHDDGVRLHAKRSSDSNGLASTTRLFPPEASAAFRTFVKQILTATLVAPEDLVLALYYVAKIPSASLIPPTKSDHSAGSSAARASAVKAAPFKILLGALMLANKTLQDNSYRNDVWALVSGIPLKDVNELEVFIFSALGFDVAVREDLWRTWLGVVCARTQSKGSNIADDVLLRAALQRLHQIASKGVASPCPTRSSPITHAPMLHDFEMGNPETPQPGSVTHGRDWDRHERLMQGLNETAAIDPALRWDKGRPFPTSYTRRTFGNELRANQVQNVHIF